MNLTSDLGLIWILPILLISIGLSVLLYHKNPWFLTLPTWTKRSLFALRTLSLTLLGILVLGLIFKASTYRHEKPILLQVIDNSASLLNYKDSASVKSTIKQYLAAANSELKEKFDIKTYLIDSELASSDSVTLTGEKSHLSLAFEKLHHQFYKRNVGAITLITDGNFNEGSSPLFQAAKFINTPIHALYVGDTAQKKDLVLKEIYSNDIAFLRNKFPLEVQVEAHKYPNREITIGIYKGGNLLAQKKVRTKGSNFEYLSVNFELEARELGFQHYDVVVQGLPDEYTLKNNRKAHFIEVVDGRSKVLLLAQAPHPDLSALKAVLEKDENRKVELHYIPSWKQDLKDVDLLVWHDPAVGYNRSIGELLLKKNIPTFYILGSRTNQETINQLGLNFQVANSRQSDEVQAKVSSAFTEFTLDESLTSSLTNFPPVTVKYGPVRLNGKQKIMLYQGVGGIQKSEPLLFFGERENTKYGVFFGENLWKWKLYEYSQTKDFLQFSNLIQKITQYLSLQENRTPLRISLPKHFYTFDEIKLQAEFYNASLELITSPTITFKLVSNGKSSTYSFLKTDKSYQLNLGRLAKGSYSWEASCAFNGTSYRKSGQFVVEELAIEKLDNRANVDLLAAISTANKGSLKPLKDFQKTIDALRDNQELVAVSYEESSYKDLIDFKWYFVILILTLTAEWLIRRRNGAY